ncbi:MAG: hypothetical protein NTX26_01885 [Candidatus Parcubacteria bacterium]|nr:hypothetical protein [Candidatus Parcubacteria bacterium]
MNKKLIIPIITVGIAVIILGVLMLRRPNNSIKSADITKNASGQIICQENTCIGNSFRSCTPAVYTMQGNSNGTPVSVVLSVSGLKDSKCQYEMNVSGHGLRCQFSPDSLNDKVFNEMFGNDEGQASIIAQSCTQF